MDNGFTVSYCLIVYPDSRVKETNPNLTASGSQSPLNPLNGWQMQSWQHLMLWSLPRPAPFARDYRCAEHCSDCIVYE
jgi:hypothetical protein